MYWDEVVRYEGLIFSEIQEKLNNHFIIWIISHYLYMFERKIYLFSGKTNILVFEEENLRLISEKKFLN